MTLWEEHTGTRRRRAAVAQGKQSGVSDLGKIFEAGGLAFLAH